jgi:SAM-dependent methyltransferase
MKIRSLVSGVSWKNPVINALVHAADPFDYVARKAAGRSYIPPYSIRIRSNGVRQDIGGEGFVRVGKQIAALLQKHAGLTPDSRVLELGCGCGRNALGLSGVLNAGNYTGMDIERVALEAAKNNQRLLGKKFQFDFLDVRNDTYNPDGEYPATEYVFPYGAQSFDVVFMISVLTHMLTDEVKNYAKEIARVLKPGGRCFATTYLLDRPMTSQFPFSAQQHSYANEAVPGIAVAYYSSFLVSTFAANGLCLTAGPLWGTVHSEGQSETGLDQDLTVFSLLGHPMQSTFTP